MGRAAAAANERPQVSYLGAAIEYKTRHLCLWHGYCTSLGGSVIKYYWSEAMIGDTRLLVVDDEDTICRGCRRFLAREGFRVRTSTDPTEGLSLAKDWDWDAILLDIRMPDLDGVQFLEELRKTKPDTPVIIITGYPSEETEVSTKNLGATHYIRKPFSPDKVTQAVEELLRPEDLQGWI